MHSNWRNNMVWWLSPFQHRKQIINHNYFVVELVTLLWHKGPSSNHQSFIWTRSFMENNHHPLAGIAIIGLFSFYYLYVIFLFRWEPLPPQCALWLFQFTIFFSSSFLSFFLFFFAGVHCLCAFTFRFGQAKYISQLRNRSLACLSLCVFVNKITQVSNEINF